MSTERPYLRAVQPERKHVPEPAALDWRCTPTSLAEIHLVATEIQRAFANAGDNEEQLTEIEHALENIETALRDEPIGLEMEQGTIRQNLRPLTASFESMSTFANDLVTHPNLWLREHARHIAEILLTRVIELAKRSSTSVHAAPNPAFKYVLLNYQTHPDYQTITDENLIQPRDVNHPATTAERSQEQMTLEKMGKKLRGAHTTLELIERISVALPEAERIYFNSTLHQRSFIRDRRALIESVLGEVRTQGSHALETEAVLLRAGTAPDEITTARLPEIGSFNTAAIVLSEIKRELDKFERIRTRRHGALRVEDCQSWIHLLWYVYQEIEPAQRFAFSVTNEDGLEEIRHLTGHDIQALTENSSFDRELIKVLPGDDLQKLLTPGGQFLPILRAKLDHFLL